MIRIKNVNYLSEYNLELLFSDGKTKIVDLENWINKGGVYILPLRDVKYFKKVVLDEFNYTICWPNGANFSPDALYEIGTEIKKQKKKSAIKIKRRKQGHVISAPKPNSIAKKVKSK